jgi:hypothetical protein
VVLSAPSPGDSGQVNAPGPVPGPHDSVVLTRFLLGAATSGGADALTDGFKLGFTVSGAVMLAAFLAAVLLLRDDGRGQPINLAELQAAG